MLGREGFGWGEPGSEPGAPPPTIPNHPPPPHKPHKHLIMPKEKGAEWDYLTPVQPEGADGAKQSKNKCKLCEHVYHGGAWRIRQHLLQVAGSGVASCTAPGEQLEPVKKVMQQIEQKSKQKEQQEAKDRQLDKAMALPCSISGGSLSEEAEDPFLCKTSEKWKLKVGWACRAIFTDEFYRAHQPADFTICEFKAIFSIL